MLLGIHSQRHIHASRQGGFEQLMWTEAPIPSAFVRSCVRQANLLSVGETCEKLFWEAVRVDHMWQSLGWGR